MNILTYASNTGDMPIRDEIGNWSKHYTTHSTHILWYGFLLQIKTYHL